MVLAKKAKLSPVKLSSRVCILTETDAKDFKVGIEYACSTNRHAHYPRAKTEQMVKDGELSWLGKHKRVATHRTSRVWKQKNSGGFGVKQLVRGVTTGKCSHSHRLPTLDVYDRMKPEELTSPKDRKHAMRAEKQPRVADGPETQLIRRKLFPVTNKVNQRRIAK